ncbi:MAG: hypothetical protein M1371_04115 [Actinobacteria bacterium]|nr:hypothetical protein [Actinomycetota bacterium]
MTNKLQIKKNQIDASERITGTIPFPKYIRDRLREAKEKRKEKLYELDKSLSKISPELAKAIDDLYALKVQYGIVESTENRILGDFIRLSAAVELGEANQTDVLKVEEKLNFLKQRSLGLSLAIKTQRQRISKIRENAREELIRQYKAEHKIAVTKILRAWEKLIDANKTEKELRSKLRKILKTDENLLPGFQVIINTSREIWLNRMKQYGYKIDGD